MSPVVEKQDKKIQRQIVKSVRQIVKILGVKKKDTRTKEKKDTVAEITDEQIDKIIQVTYELRKGVSPTQAALLYRSSFVMLISYFEYLISDLIQYFFRKYPESLSEKRH